MIHLLTSNLLPIRSIKDYNDNFVFCHIHTERIVPILTPTYRFIFEIYHQDEMVFDEDVYEDTEDFIFHFHPVATMTEALDQIAESMIQFEQAEASKDEDLRDELTFAVCCDYNWSRQVFKYMNSAFGDHDSELSCLDLYQYLKVPSTQKMKELIGSILNSEFIYPEDSISFGYAIHRAIDGRVR